jgi:NAD(P)-dependent dehydrogenase (short-subunit alcohol dehydrogenase family)
MKVVVITGSTRGIGYGLNVSFLDRDCAITVTGRTEEGVSQAVDKLRRAYDPGRVEGCVCDVRDPHHLDTLWQQALLRYGKVDIWINNAGVSNPQAKVWEISPKEAQSVVDTNLMGVIYGSQTAIKGMLEQGHGSLYNMQGMGSDGRMHAGLILYGMTKYGVHYFTKGLVKELEGTPLIVGSISPGMLVTDLVTSQYKDRPEEWERVKPIFNIIADRVEIVAPWLADRILENKKSGVHISRLSRWKLLYRFLSAPFVKRDVFGDSLDGSWES